MQRDSVDFLETCGALGDIVNYRFVNRRMVGLHHPDLVKDVLLTRHELFVKKGIYSRMNAVFRNGLLTAEGEFWKKQRRIIQPSFTRKNLNTMVAAMSEEAAGFRDELLESADSNQTVDAFEAMLKIALRIITKTMFSNDVSGRHREIAEHIYAINAFLKHRNFSYVPLPTWIPTPSHNRFRHALKSLDSIVMELVRERMQREDPGDDLLGMLLKSTDPETGKRMPMHQVRAEAITIFITGHETTATALSWAYYEMAKAPKLAEELYQTVDAVFGSSVPEFTGEAMKELGCLDNIFYESIRMHPPIYVTYRQAAKDVTLGGVRIRRGDTVHISPLIANYDTRYWNEPESFNPQRFKGGAEGDDKFVFFPFGVGPRSCIGSHFALLEARIIMTTLAQALKFELVDPHFVAKPEPLVTLKPRSPLPMRVRRR
ncbi:cytochrome P450 [Coraliomargarita sinensis]|nr:cytochrome P450 [Coraliomargarita sinensis]